MDSSHNFVFLMAVSVRITSFRRYSARSSGFYRSLRFVLSRVRAGDSHLEDKVPREFSGLALFRKKTSETTRCGPNDVRYRSINIYQD